MSFTDKTLTCADCSTTFTFSANEQEFFASKQLTNEPKRCPECRQAKKLARSGNNDYGRSQRQMFSTVCAQCGQNTQVPFEPRDGRPVYCSSCYNTVKQSR
jgi:CxxC-x17-CxxC domain-containing protein